MALSGGQQKRGRGEGKKAKKKKERERERGRERERRSGYALWPLKKKVRKPGFFVNGERLAIIFVKLIKMVKKKKDPWNMDALFAPTQIYVLLLL